MRYKMLQCGMVTLILAQRWHRHVFSFADKLLFTKPSRISIIAQKVSVWSSKTSELFDNLAAITIMTLSMQ